MRIVGLISGTSADAVETVLADVSGAPPALKARVVAARSSPVPHELQARIHAAATKEGSDVEAIAILDHEIGEAFAAATLALLDEAGVEPGDVDLLGSAGQTIWHAVREDGSVAGTLQIGSGAIIAERTGITTVADIRSRDVAAGGQGAPIVAYVDRLLLTHANRTRAVQNMGGIGNVAWLPPASDPEGEVIAFDTGPANALIDIVVGRITYGRLAFDEDGQRARAGTADEDWIERQLSLPYYAAPPPKTTGRELFSPAMGAALLAEGRDRGLSDDDIIATLTALSAATVADQYERFLPSVPDEVIVAGGGARNPVLMEQLRARLPAEADVRTLDDVGTAAEAKEALAVAVIAHETWHRRPGNLPSATGARHPVVMGAIHTGRLG